MKLWNNESFSEAVADKIAEATGVDLVIVYDHDKHSLVGSFVGFGPGDNGKILVGIDVSDAQDEAYITQWAVIELEVE